MMLVPASALMLGGLAFEQTHSISSALTAACRGALAAFGGWALAREIAPDDNAASFVSMSLALGALLLVPSSGVLPLFCAIMLARILNRSVGIPATLADSAAVTLLVAWTVYSDRSPGPAVVAAVGFSLDALLPPPLRRQWSFAALCLAGGLLSLAFRELRESSNETLGPLEVSVLIVAVLVPLLIMLTRHIRSVADVTGVPLDLNRVRAAMGVAWIMGMQGMLSAEIASSQVLLVWAVLAGVILMAAVRALAIRTIVE
jgi:hypothetical protein